MKRDAPPADAIVIRGARQNNLKNLTLSLPASELIVVTGVSGSGKSSLAFDQTNPVRTSRSTVGTMTELNDHLKLLFARASKLHCRKCGKPVRRDTPQSIYESLAATPDARLEITFPVPVPKNFSEKEVEELLQRQGYTKLRSRSKTLIEVIQDRVRPGTTEKAGTEWRRPGRFARATLFRMDVDDEIHLDPFTAGAGNRNLPPSRRQGVEPESSWQATPALKLSAGYAYTDAKFLEGTMPGNAFIGTNLSIAGKRVPLVPEHKLNLALAWDFAARTRLPAALTALSKQYLDNDEPNTLGVQIPAFALVDLKLAREFDWGRIAAAVNNLFDEQYYTYAVRSQFVADRYAVYPLPGRTFSVTAELKLD